MTLAVLGLGRRGVHLTKTLPGRLELPTLRLTASRSNQLSYGSSWPEDRRRHPGEAKVRPRREEEETPGWVGQ